MKKNFSIKNSKTKLETNEVFVDEREKRKTLTIAIPASLHTRIKITAAKRGEHIAKMICNILEKKIEDLE